MGFKYNPGMLDDAELIRAFVVRNESLGLILEALRDNTASSGANRHLLIVGPRGSGKTMLVRRAAAEVRKDQAYGSQWFPLVFGEEAYQVSTPGEFWLEALFHLADQSGDARWGKAVEDLRRELDEQRLRERALGQLLDFAAEQGKRLLLVVENLNMLCDQITPEAAWELRHTLTNESRVMLLGTATSRFDEVTKVDRAWFEMFSIHELKPLIQTECATLWQSVTKEPLVPSRAPVIRILTGGNPRLITILAGFAANRSFRELMEQLVHLLDDHTEYFKGHLDTLGPQERKVFAAVLDRWDPVSAAEVAELSRLSVNEASTLLGRLVGRGAVEVVEERKRRKVYQAAERLYNLYYLMRRRGHSEARVHLAVRFMVTYYRSRELVSRLSELAEDACRLPAGAREDHYLVYRNVLVQAPRWAPRILESTPPEFFEASDAPEYIRALARSARPEEAFHEARRPKDEVEVLCRTGRFEEAEERLRETVGRDGGNVQAWHDLGNLLTRLERWGEAEQAFRNGIEADPKQAWTWNGLGDLLARLERWGEAEQAFRNGIEADPKHVWSWHDLGNLLARLGRWGEAEQAFRNGIEADPKHVWTWRDLGNLLARLGRWGEAEQAFRNGIEADPKHVWTWHDLGNLLVRRERWEEAEQAFRSAIEADPEHVWTWNSLALLLRQLGRRDQAQEAWVRALEIDPRLWFCLVQLLAVRIESGLAPDAIFQEARERVERSRGDAGVLREVARFIARAGLAAGLPQAEEWAREACSKEPGWESADALAWVLATEGRWGEALAASRPVLDAAPSEEDAQQSVTEFLIQAAAGGHAPEALETLIASAGAPAMEPLAVGLRIFAGESPLVAKEILEIGQDVAERIRTVAAGRAPAAREWGHGRAGQ